MKPNLQRMFIYVKDVMNMSGKGERYARLLLSTIRKLKGKEKHQPVTVHDYCEYTGLSLEQVLPYLD